MISRSERSRYIVHALAELLVVDVGDHDQLALAPLTLGCFASSSWKANPSR